MKHALYDREDGLAHCRVCGGAEGTLPKDCPDRRLTATEARAIWDGKLNFVDGKWVGQTTAGTGDGEVRTCGSCGFKICVNQRKSMGVFKPNGTCYEWTPKPQPQVAPVESDYVAVPEMRGTEQIGVTFERKDAPTFPNARDCEHGRQQGKCPECDLVESTKEEMFLSGEVARLRRERDRILAVLKDEALKCSVVFESVHAGEYHADEIISRYCARVLAEVGEIKT